MVVQYSKKQIEDLVDGKLPFPMVHNMLSSYKDPDRFDRYIEILEERVPWSERILLPYGLHLYIVEKTDGARVVKCDCGKEFGSYKENWKYNASIRIRSTDEEMEELYPPMMYCDTEYMELREYLCPSCLTLLEVEAVPPGYPIVFDFQPDLETFYKEWLGRELHPLD